MKTGMHRNSRCLLFCVCSVAVCKTMGVFYETSWQRWKVLASSFSLLVVGFFGLSLAFFFFGKDAKLALAKVKRGNSC